MKKIAIEEHFSTEEQINLLQKIMTNTYPVPGVVEEEEYVKYEAGWARSPLDGTERGSIVKRTLLDIGEGRIKEMDKTGIDMQVLSLVSPGVQMLDAAAGTALARNVNDHLAAAVKKHPDRFQGLAAIAPQDPQAAAMELERAVTKLGLKGTSINSHVKGEYLDDKKFWPIFEVAAKLKAPIYIHPRVPSGGMLAPYVGYPGLASASCGFAAEVGLHSLRLICSGVFDKYPNLKIIIGHMGEALPYWLWRIDNRLMKTPGTRDWPKPPSQYFKDNFLITTSGMFSLPPLICAYMTLGADNILFAVDYPMEFNEEAVPFIEAAPISDGDKEKICHLNAEKYLKL
ncbi:MAG: amidohydrolase family protein [Chloroflexota bacterium]